MFSAVLVETLSPVSQHRRLIYQPLKRNHCLPSYWGTSDWWFKWTQLYLVRCLDGTAPPVWWCTVPPVFLWQHVRGATYTQQLRRQKLWSCRSTNLEQSATRPATSVRNSLKRYWKHVCLTRPRRLVTFIYTCRRFRNILTYLLTYFMLV